MLLAILLAAAVAPPPSPVPAPTPALKTIVRVRVSGRCSTLLSQSNDAITAALGDNRLLTQTITQLRLARLDDGNVLHRVNDLASLRDLAGSLQAQAHAGTTQIARLRDLETNGDDPAEEKELKLFIDALSGALGRQLKMAHDLNSYLASVDYIDMSGFGDDEEQTDRFVFGAPPVATQGARSIATDFTARLPAMVSDENVAATHVDGALAGC